MKNNRIIILTFFFSAFHWALKGQEFENIADSIGLESNYTSADLWGSGVSFYDYNNDGFDDVTLIKENDSIVFYESVNGELEESHSFIFGEGEVKSLLWVDYDNDGFLDLFMTIRNGPYRLYRNDGQFNFSDVSDEAGLDFSNSRTYGASFADINNDGFLDLYVAKYEFGFTEEDVDKLNQLYRNNGDGTFTNITLSSGVGDSIQASFQGVWFDCNLDGFVDLYVINDRMPFSNTLYLNNGDETFSEATETSGLSMSGEEPMSTTVGDFDNDGDLDIYITNTGNFIGGTGAFHTAKLYVNNGDGSFDELANEFNVALDKWSWGAVWIDYDNNMWKDLFVSTAIPSNTAQQYQDVFYINQEGQFFIEDNSPFINNNDSRSTGAARGDINNDGYYDLLIQNNMPGNPYIWRSRGGENNYIKITPNGTISNRFAVGSWIKVYANGRRLVEYTFCGENYMSQNSQHQIFGLKNINMVDSVEIIYPSGHKDTYYDLPANEHYYFYEGETLSATVEYTDTLLCQGDSTIVYANNLSNVTWNNGVLSDSITVNEDSQVYYSGVSEFGIMVHSDTITISFSSAPFLSALTTNPTCYDEDDGEIQVVFFHDTSGIDLQLFHGDIPTESQLSGLPSGNHSIYYFDSAGCQDSLSIYLQAPPSIVNSYFISNETFGDDGVIDVMTFGGVPPYSYELDGQLIEPPFDGLSGGSYTIKVIDDNDCLLMDTVDVFSTLSNGDFKFTSEEIFIYPNPVKSGEILTIFNGNPEIHHYFIYSQDGKLVANNVVKSNSVLINQEPGVYILKLFDVFNTLLSTEKVVVE